MNRALITIVVLSLVACQHRKIETVITVDSLASPSTGSAGQPYFNIDSAGAPYLSWQQDNKGQTYLLFSAWKDNMWSKIDTLASGTDWIVNWADFPSFAFQGQHGIANYLQRTSEEKFSYDVKLARFGEQQKTSGLTLHRDSTLTEHGFVSLQPWQEGFVATWLDGRNTGGEGHEGHDGHHGSMSLRAAFLDLHGNVKSEWEIDHRTCDCCQTSMVITDQGPVIAYRDRSQDEVRDMSIVRWTGDGWSQPGTPYRDGWQIKGCPVNGPRLAARGNQVAMVWFTAVDDSTRIQIGFSQDAGLHFGESKQLNTARATGRVDVCWVDDVHVLVSWIQDGRLVVSLVDNQGVIQSPVTVAAISDVRGSGFPRMVATGREVFLAWTDADRNQLAIRKLTLGQTSR
jgi:hypothetical protein